MNKFASYLLAAVAVLPSCAKMDLEGDIVEGEDSAIVWMTSLSDEMPLARMSIPGAHDAASATITAWTAWTRTQDFNVAELWNCGVRAFDLRPAWKDGAIGIYHDKYSAHVSLSQILQTLSLALAKHPGECAIIIIRHEEEADGDSPQWPEAMARTLSGFTDCLADWHQGLTLGDIRGKILILSRNTYKGGPIGGYIRGWTSGDDILSQKGAGIVGKDGISSPLWVQDYYHPQGKNDKWQEVKELLDATGSASELYPLVINHASGYVGTLPDYRSNARDINQSVAQYIRDTCTPTGIVMMDFAGVGTSKGVNVSGDALVKALIENN